MEETVQVSLTTLYVTKTPFNVLIILLSNHQHIYLIITMQIVAWFDIQTTPKTEEHDQSKPPLHKLPLQIDWSENSKTNFRKAFESIHLKPKTKLLNF